MCYMKMDGKFLKIWYFAPGGLWQVGQGTFSQTFFVVEKFEFRTERRCFNATKWPEIPQKWIRSIPFGKGNTLGTLNHGLESLFYCFITLFGLKSSLVPPGAPWRLPGPPGAPLTPGMSSWAIVSHPGSLWVIFDPSGVSNWGVSLLCIAVQCSAILCFFALFAFFASFWAFLDFFLYDLVLYHHI